MEDGARIESLDLSCNSRMRDDGARALARAIASSSCSLTRLDLSSINCGPKGAAALFEALASNASLHSLFLGSKSADRNLIGPTPIAQLAASLLVNTCLTSLNLSSNGVGPEGTKLLAPAMLVNTSLRALDLRSNSLLDAAMPFVGASTSSSRSSLTLHPTPLSSPPPQEEEGLLPLLLPLLLLLLLPAPPQREPKERCIPAKEPPQAAKSYLALGTACEFQ